MAWLFLWLLSRACVQYATWQCEGLWGGIWKAQGQPYDVSHSDPDWPQHALVCLQRCHHHRLSGRWPRLVRLLCCKQLWRVWLSNVEQIHCSTTQITNTKCMICIKYLFFSRWLSARSAPKVTDSSRWPSRCQLLAQPSVWTSLRLRIQALSVHAGLL